MELEFSKLEFHFKKIMELVFASLEFHLVYFFFKAWNSSLLKANSSSTFFFKFTLGVNLVSQTRFWVGTRVSQTQVSKNSQTY